MTPEGRVKDMWKRRLKRSLAEDVWTFMPVQSGFGATALDFLHCVYGCFVAVETKVKGKDLSPRQKIVKAMIERAGGTVLVVDDEASADRAISIMLSLGKAALGAALKS